MIPEHDKPTIRPRGAVGQRSTALIGAALFCGVLALYVSTLTQVHTFDALSYVTSVERKPWNENLHPHHLAYGPLGELANAIGMALGYTGGAALPLQIVNALAGAFGAAWFFRILAHLTDRILTALAGTLLLSASYAYWYYAVEIEVYTVATLFLIICLGLVLRPGLSHNRSRLALLGLVQAGAVLFHQTNALLCIPIACFAWMEEDSRIAERVRQMLRWWPYALTLALGVAIPYGLAGFVVSGFRSLDDMVAWLTEYARTGWWGGPITGDTWDRLIQGWSETFAQPGGFGIGLGLLALGVLRGRALFRIPPPQIGFLLSWLLVYGLFFTWWEPDNIEFWIAGLPPLLTCLALLQRSAPSIEPAAALLVALTAGTLNYDAILRRGNPQTDLQRVIARELAAHSTPADLLIIPDGLLELYLPYYQQRENFISLNQALFDARGNWEAACTTIRTRIEQAEYAGATAIIADEARIPPPELLQRFALSAQQPADCFEIYTNDLQALGLPGDLPGYTRLPTGQERAEGNGWDFVRHTQGWRAANAATIDVSDGWTLRPAADPALTSPLLNLDARQLRQIEIRLANRTGARDAQLFVAGPDGTINEQRSLRWELQPGSAAHTYTLDLAGIPDLPATITRIRIDPIGVGDGESVTILSVRVR